MLRLAERGLYCEAGDFYIDPWQPVDARRHHARARRPRALGVARATSRSREGEARAAHAARAERRRSEPLDWGEPVDMNGVRVSLHPAGHILGSAQIRVEHRGEVWVVVGRLQDRSRPDLHAVRARALPHVHHREHVRAADLSLDARAPRSSPRFARGGATNRDDGPRVGAVRVRAGQSAARCSPDSPTPTSGRSTRTARSSD